MKGATERRPLERRSGGTPRQRVLPAKSGMQGGESPKGEDFFSRGFH